MKHCQMSEPSLPVLHSTEDDSQPTRLLPNQSEASESSPTGPHTPGNPPEVSQDTRRLAQPKQGARPSQPAPWLMTGEQPFGGATVEQTSSLASDPDMLGDEVLEAPPDITGASVFQGGGNQVSGYGLDDYSDVDDDLVVRRTDLGPLFKVGIPIVLIVAVAVTAYFLLPMWNRTTPTARLDIRSHPAGAHVYLDGQPRPSLTPTAIEGLEMGSVHQVELRLDGFVPWSQSVEMGRTEVRQIAILRPILGTLRVTSEPIGASVSVDGVYQGVTPCEVVELDINRDVRVQVRYQRQTQTREHSWQGQTEAVLNFEFEEEPRGRSRYR